jgi:hypothetical protein
MIPFISKIFFQRKKEKSNKPFHSPDNLPWIARKRGVYLPNCPVIPLAWVADEETASHIVKCVNHFDEIKNIAQKIIDTDILTDPNIKKELQQIMHEVDQ